MVCCFVSRVRRSFFLFFPFSLFPLVFPFWVFSALLVLADLFSPFGFRRALYVAWVCFAWFYFLLDFFFCYMLLSIETKLTLRKTSTPEYPEYPEFRRSDALEPQ